MTLKVRIRQLEEENAALREKLNARLKLDKIWQGNLSEGVHAVAANISNFSDLNKERILLAVAVLYGLIKPGEKETVPLDPPPPSPSDPTGEKR